MSYIITLVSSREDEPLADSHIERAVALVREHDVMMTCAPIPLKAGKAVDIGVASVPSYALLRDIRNALAYAFIDVLSTPIEGRVKKLVLADMDSTMVTGETLDDLAAHAGIKEQVADITARAMNGELDFHDALRERVGLLKGLSVEFLQKTLDAIEMSPGAEVFIEKMRAHGAYCVLVSGGFTFFTSNVGRRLGFHENYGNILKIEKGVLTGEVEQPILDKHSKVNFLRRCAAAHNLQDADCLTIGDGANDIPMLEKAGFGIGYRPKGAVEKVIDNQIVYGDLTTALYAQGIVPD